MTETQNLLLWLDTILLGVLLLLLLIPRLGR